MNKFNQTIIAQQIVGGNMLPAIPGAEAPINKEFAWEVTLLCGDDHYEERERRHAISKLRLYVLNNDIGIFPSNYREEVLPSLGGNILAEFCYQAVDQFDSYEEFFYEKEYCPHINKSAPPVPKDKDIEDIPF